MKNSFPYLEIRSGDQIIMVRQFFETWFKELRANQESALDMYLTEVYESKGIIGEQPDTWKGAQWPVHSRVAAAV